MGDRIRTNFNIEKRLLNEVKILCIINDDNIHDVMNNLMDDYIQKGNNKESIEKAKKSVRGTK